MDCNKLDQLSPDSFCSYTHLRSNQQIQWTGSVEQKIWGLMIVWSEAKFNFPFFDRITDVNWENKVQEYIPRVINTGTIDEYYQVLMEFAAILKDGHTAVVPPWITFPRIMKSEYDYPPVELLVIEDKFYVARISNTEELLKQRIYPGLEVLEIGEQTPIQDYLKENILRFKSYGTSQADETVGLIGILSGPKDSQVLLKVRDPDGTIRLVSLTRNSTDEEGTIFQWRLAQGFMSDSFIESKLFPSGICYIQILSFLNKKMVEEFQKIIDDLDLPSIRGIILDVRHNLGGNDMYVHNIISFLTDEPLKASRWKSICYVPAYRSWSHPIRWEEHAPNIIEPRSCARATKEDLLQGKDAVLQKGIDVILNWYFDHK